MEIKEIEKTFVRVGYENSVIMYVLSMLYYFKMDVSKERIKEKLLLEKKENTTLSEVASALEDVGFITEGFQAESVSNLDELTNPAIIPIYSDEGLLDFAVFYGKQANKYLIGLPFWGLNLYTDWEFEAIWENHILLEVRKF
ncbi:MAG: cysteine peptidase family C39 domain-containing protein [Candidatus Azobacteroides sp.]|nr:cysteine peptidase family C39 domain-containing protein [Candidatus Azobacteroides sp.]